MLEIRNISKSFGGLKALNNVSIPFERGKINAIIGPNGAGKSTLFEIISGLEIQNTGKILFDNIDISSESPHNRANRGISRTFQHVRMFKNLSVEKHIEFALNNDDQSFFGNIFSRNKSYHKEVKDVLQNVGFDNGLHVLANDLSYGQRKLLDLAIALTKKHELILLDEPVAGVTPKLRDNIKQILLNHKKSGKTIILIEHDMNFVMDIADKVFVLANGSVIAHGTPKQVRENKLVLEAYLGE